MTTSVGNGAFTAHCPEGSTTSEVYRSNCICSHEDRTYSAWIPESRRGPPSFSVGEGHLPPAMTRNGNVMLTAARPQPGAEVVADVVCKRVLSAAAILRHVVFRRVAVARIRRTSSRSSTSTTSNNCSKMTTVFGDRSAVATSRRTLRRRMRIHSAEERLLRY